MSHIVYSKKNTVFISIGVSNLNRAKDFYINSLGFEINFDAGEEVGWCELKLQGNDVLVGLNRYKEDELIIGSTSLCLTVEDLDVTREFLLAKKVETGEITDIPDMVSMMRVNDSEGNTILFVSSPRKKS
jgi:predicted enzyme related to lactoylglutathione lyase